MQSTCEHLEHSTSGTTSDLMKSSKQLCKEHWHGGSIGKWSVR